MDVLKKILKEIAEKAVLEYEFTADRRCAMVDTDVLREIIRANIEGYDWISVEEKLPANDNFVLLSFSNFSLPMIGRYERDEEGGGAWYLGDCDEDDTCLANDLFVNAWMPLPEAYKEDADV